MRFRGSVHRWAGLRGLGPGISKQAEQTGAEGRTPTLDPQIQLIAARLLRKLRQNTLQVNFGNGVVVIHLTEPRRKQKTMLPDTAA